MATNQIANYSRTRLVASLRAARSSLANLREKAERGLERTTIGIAAPVGGAAAGYLHGYAEKNGTDITIGDTQITYTAVGGVILTLAGAFGESIMGETIANVALGLGSGALALEAGMAAYKYGVKP